MKCVETKGKGLENWMNLITFTEVNVIRQEGISSKWILKEEELYDCQKWKVKERLVAKRFQD